MIRHFTSLLLLLVALIPSLRAQVPIGYLEVSDYLEPFARSNVYSSGSWGDPTGRFVPPLGWDVAPDSWTYGNNTYTVSYTATSSGKEGYCIGNTESQLRKAIGADVYHEMYDLIVTPRVKGKISFWLKPYSTAETSKPCVSLFKLHKTEDGFTFDATSDSIAWKPTAMPGASWYLQEVDIPSVGYEYIGIRLQRVYIDEFQAEKAQLPENRSLQWGSTASMLPGYVANSLKSDSEGNVKVGFAIQLTNTGNIAVPAGKKARLMRVISASPYSVAEAPLAEVELPRLAPGESAPLTVETTFKVPTDVPLSDGKVKFRVDLWEDFTGVGEHLDGSDATQVGVGPTLEIAPYAGILSISYDTKSTAGVNVTKTLAAGGKPVYYGAFKNSRERVFHLKNVGAAPLVITGVEKDRWIELPGFNMPCTIEPDQSVDVTVRIMGSYGLKSGSAAFVFDGFSVVNAIPVSGEVIPEDDFFADFEEEGAGEVWYMPAGSTSWSVADYDSSLRSTNENIWWLEHGVNDRYLNNNRNDEPGHSVYTPKMSFAEGDSISFHAAKNQAGGSYTKIIVAYSKDRSNWIELGTITPQNDNPDLEFYYTSSPTTTGQKVFKRFSFEMPEGDYYVSLTSGNSFIDNFHGGRLCNVGVDLISEKASAGNLRKVNHPLSFSASFKNLNTASLLPAQQRVTLYADGEPVATAHADTIPSFQTVEYGFEFYPHRAGETILYAEVSVGEEKFRSSEIRVNVQPETLETMNTVGTVTATAEKFPVDLYYKFAHTEFIYSAGDLADLEGTRIMRISYPYYKTADTKVAKTIRVWLQNTDAEFTEEDKEFTPVEEMTLVYEGEDVEIISGGSGTDDMLALEFMLDTPFDYTGSNLRVVVESLNVPFARTYFGVDGNRGHYGLYRRSDSESTFPTSTIYNEETFPVINIFTDKILPPVVGTVKDTEGRPLAGATVEARNGGVCYEAVSDALGEWEMTVYQDQLEYTLTVSLPGYQSFTGTLDMNGSNDVVLKSMASNLAVEVSPAVEGYSVEGLKVEVLPLDSDSTVAPFILAADGKALFEILPHGQYAIYIDGAQRGLEVYEELEYTHSGEATLTVTLDEDPVDPFNVSESVEKNADGAFDVTLTWNRRGDVEMILPYVFTVVVDGDLEYVSDVNGITFSLTEAGDHEAVIKGTTPSGRITGSVSHSFYLESHSTSGVESVGDEDEWRYFDLNGVAVEGDTLSPGVYIRVRGTVSEKVIVP